MRQCWDVIAKLRPQSVSVVIMKECLKLRLLWAFSEKLRPLLAFTRQATAVKIFAMKLKLHLVFARLVTTATI